MRGWKGISLAVVVACAAGSASGQTPLPLPPTGVAPAAAEPWKQWPANPPAAPPVAEKTMTFRKPAGAEASQIVPVAGQPPATDAQPPATAAQPPAASMGSELPSKDKVFRLDNDKVMETRIKEFVAKPDLRFPVLPKLDPTGAPYVAKSYPPSKVDLEPGYVVHRRLLFEEKNSERYGWELGAAQPLISAAYFYKDCALLPYHLAANICERYDTGAGKCLPGSPVPYYLYPPDFSITGTTAELGVVTGLAFIFP